MELVQPWSFSGPGGRDGGLDRTLARTDAVDEHVHAWVRLDRATTAVGDGPLAGLPVTVKDIVDVAGLPTECGSASRRGMAPAERDADVVARLRAAGALIAGKSVTTEFAFYDPGPTRNPHDPARTPGGSSSGSAAAVAAGMVPLAVGTQTAGSVARPAAFCGIAGYATPHGVLPRTGIAPLAPGLDTVGLFAATVADLAVARPALDGSPRPGTAAPSRPHLLTWDGGDVAEVDPAMLAAHAEAVARVAGAGADLEPGGAVLGAGSMRRLSADHRTIMAAEAATSVPADALASGLLGRHITGLVEEGRAVAPDALGAARGHATAAREVMLDLLGEVDAILAPAALGPAPHGLASTGDPAMSRPWHLLGLPIVCVPGLRDAHGMPLGLQLVGHPDREGGLLALGRWLEELLAGR